MLKESDLHESWEAAKEGINGINAAFRGLVLSNFTNGLPDRELLASILRDTNSGDLSLEQRVSTESVMERLGSWIETQAIWAKFASRCYEPERRNGHIVIEPDCFPGFIKSNDFFNLSRVSAIRKDLLDTYGLRAILLSPLNPDYEKFEKLIKSFFEERDALIALERYPEERNELIEYVALLISSLHEETNYVTLGLVDDAIKFSCEQVFRSNSVNKEDKANATAALIKTYDPVPKLRVSAYYSTASDGKNELRDLDNLTESQLAFQVIENERLTSDLIRSKVIPSLIKAVRRHFCSLRNCYWNLHERRFHDHPVLSQNFGASSVELSDYSRISTLRGYHTSFAANIRTIEVCCGNSYVHLLPSHLPKLEIEFFKAVKAGIKNPPKGDGECAMFLAKIHAFLAIAHFPYDGSGRTDEDFVNLVSRLIKFEGSLSNSGYRAHLSPLAQEMEAELIKLKLQSDLEAIRRMGLKPGPFREDYWYSDLYSLIRKVSPKIYLGIQVQKSLDAWRLIEEIPRHACESGFIKRFPSINNMSKLWEQAREEQYRIIQQQEYANKLSALMAESIVTAPELFRRELVKRSDEISGNALGYLFLREHLYKRHARFVSDKQFAHFDKQIKSLKLLQRVIES